MFVPVVGRFAILLVLVQLVITIAQKDIYDPRNIFCGKVSCYDVLNVTRKAPAREIKRAYRRLSLENHPDKSKADNATKVFKRIAKAYEVLNGNESRPLFDYYLDHPRDYFKVSGHHYFRNLPKSDVRLVIFLVACLLSWFFYVMQNQRYENAVKSIKTAMASTNGGAKQIVDLQNRAAALYDDYIKKAKDAGDKKAGKMVKMLKDPIYLKFVDEVVASLKIEGGCRKPEINDLFIVQAAMFPLKAYNWAVTYHRRYISTQPLSDAEKIDMAIEALGVGTWGNLTIGEQKKVVEMEIWKSAVLSKWQEDNRTEDDEGVEKLSKTQQKKMKKFSKKEENLKMD